MNEDIRELGMAKLIDLTWDTIKGVNLANELIVTHPLVREFKERMRNLHPTLDSRDDTIFDLGEKSETVLRMVKIVYKSVIKESEHELINKAFSDIDSYSTYLKKPKWECIQLAAKLSKCPDSELSFIINLMARLEKERKEIFSEVFSKSKAFE